MMLTIQEPTRSVGERGGDRSGGSKKSDRVQLSTF